VKIFSHTQRRKTEKEERNWALGTIATTAKNAVFFTHSFFRDMACPSYNRAVKTMAVPLNFSRLLSYTVASHKSFLQHVLHKVTKNIFFRVLGTPPFLHAGRMFRTF
jgi:hypothetical protein